MTIASVLAAFRIERGLDDSGKPIDPQPNYLPGVSRLVRNLHLWLLCLILIYQIGSQLRSKRQFEYARKSLPISFEALKDEIYNGRGDSM